MSELYYTPAMDEFHVGFTYEWKCNSTKTPWTESTCDQKMNPLDVDCQNMNEYRVKHLDKSDIESFGFKPETLKAYTTMHKAQLYRNNNIGLIHKPDIKAISIFTFDLTKCEKCMDHGGIDANFIQSITIKNKSELKKLLKQLGIQI
jgi:hypothetical protein